MPTKFRVYACCLSFHSVEVEADDLGEAISQAHDENMWRIEWDPRWLLPSFVINTETGNGFSLDDDGVVCCTHPAKLRIDVKDENGTLTAERSPDVALAALAARHLEDKHQWPAVVRVHDLETGVRIDKTDLVHAMNALDGQRLVKFVRMEKP